MTQNPALAAAGFRLRLPEHWFDLSVSDEASENAIARQTWERCREAGFSEEQARHFTSSVRRSVRYARLSGALQAGGTFEIFEDGPFTASVVVAAATPPADGDVIGALLAAEQATPAGMSATSATSATWHRVRIVELAGIGTAGRVHGVHDVALDGGVTRSVFMHTVVPIPGSGGVLVVSGSSPNLTEADELFDLFTSITATLEFTATA
jgi:hypothetical protein